MQEGGNGCAAFFVFRLSVQSKALCLQSLKADHQALIDKVVAEHDAGLSPRQIADLLNAEGVRSWTGLLLYPALVYGIIRKARLRESRRRYFEVLAWECEVKHRARFQMETSK